MGDKVYFWGTQGGAELDLFVNIKRKRIGFEFKYTEKPTPQKSQYISVESLNLDHLYIIYLGQHIIPYDRKITAYPLSQKQPLKLPPIFG